GIEQEGTLGELFGGLPIRIEFQARLFDEVTYQGAANRGVFGVELLRPLQYFEAFLVAAQRAQLLAFDEQLARFAGSRHTLRSELIELGQFGIVGDLFGSLAKQLLGAGVVADTELPIDLFHPFGFAVEPNLLVVAAAHTIDLEIEPGVLRVDG